jgi:hypothetical protein
MALLEQGIWQQEVHIVVKILLASCGMGMKSHCTVTTKRLLSTATSCECNPNTVLVNGQTYSESAMPTDSNLASKLHGHYCTYTFSSPHPPRSALKTTYSTVKCGHGISSGLKRPGRGVNHPSNLVPRFRLGASVPVLPPRCHQAMLWRDTYVLLHLCRTVVTLSGVRAFSGDQNLNPRSKCICVKPVGT